MGLFNEITKYVILLVVFTNILHAQTNFDVKIDSLKNEIKNRNQEIEAIKEEINKLKIEKNKKRNSEVLTGGKVVEVTSSRAKLSIGEKLELSSEKIDLPKGAKITVYPIVAKYSLGYSYRAEYQGTMGWIYKSHFEEFSSGMKRLAKDDIEKLTYDKIQKELMYKNKSIEKFPVKYRDAISNNRIKVGMTREMVIASIGHPADENKTTTVYGTSIQMIYNRGKYKYVYLDNGIVDAFQQ